MAAEQRRIGRPALGFLGHRSHDQRPHGSGNVLRQRRRRVQHVAERHRDRMLADERPATRQALVGDYA
jgi:hypothetical protein